MVNIPVRIDTSGVNSQINAVNAKVTQTGQIIRNTRIEAITLFNYAMHVTNIVVSMMQRSGETVMRGIKLADILNTINIAQAEATFATTTAQSATAFATGHPGAGIAYASLAGLLQAQIIQQQAIKAQIKQQEAYMQTIRNLYNGYV